MNEKTRIYWLHTLTPLHVGIGRGLGYIDQPIMREKVTQWPLVPGSAVKGVISDRFDTETIRGKVNKDGEAALSEEDRITLSAFGQVGNEHTNSGSLVFTDSRILCLPIRSLYGTFAWCSCPMVLNRLTRDLEHAKISFSPSLAAMSDNEHAQVANLASSKLKGNDSKIYLEDLDLGVEESPEVATWASWLAKQLFSDQTQWQIPFEERFVVLPDNIFNFLCETGTEVNARVRIKDETKTVADGALWYEEALPAETILTGLIWCDRVFGTHGKTPEAKALFEKCCTTPLDLQIGGNATVGHGRVRCLFTGEGDLS